EQTRAFTDRPRRGRGREEAIGVDGSVTIVESASVVPDDEVQMRGPGADLHDRLGRSPMTDRVAERFADDLCELEARRRRKTRIARGAREMYRQLLPCGE